MTEYGYDLADRVARRGQKRMTLNVRVTAADKKKIDDFRDGHGLSMTTFLVGVALKEIEIEKKKETKCK